MIRNVFFEKTSIPAGDTITLTIDAEYPIVIEVYCFVTQPHPPRFVPCPDSGQHTLTRRESFTFRTVPQVFEESGGVEFHILDATGDLQVHRIDIEGLSSSLLSN